MTAPPISRYPVPKLGTFLTIRSRMLEVQESRIYPNLCHACAMPRRPRFSPITTRRRAARFGLTKASAMIVVATSGKNRCPYASSSRRDPARTMRTADRDQVGQFPQSGQRAAEGDAGSRSWGDALLIWSRSLLTALHAHGFSDEDIWDIGAIAAFFALSNRMADVTMRPNDEFYLPDACLVSENRRSTSWTSCPLAIAYDFARQFPIPGMACSLPPLRSRRSTVHGPPGRTGRRRRLHRRRGDLHRCPARAPDPP